jgi:methylase of polypeptide subunit release factors
MFLTRKGLQHATDEAIAGYKATRFLTGSQIFDLCCGIGGDLIALARQGKATGVDLEPLAALFAEANVQTYGLQFAIRQVDTSQATLPHEACWHCDPDRRAGGS